MSTENLHTILKRAVAEPGFRAQLFSNPVLSTAQYSLSAEELKALIALQPETLDSLAGELDQRSSMSVIWGTLVGEQPTPPGGPKSGYAIGG